MSDQSAAELIRDARQNARLNEREMRHLLIALADALEEATKERDNAELQLGRIAGERDVAQAIAEDLRESLDAEGLETAPLPWEETQ